MSTKLKEIRFKNFQHYGNSMSSVRLDHPGVTNIKGRVGSGKSTILVAIFYALKGKSFMGESIKSLINTINNKKMLVELDLAINGQPFTIIRGEKPKIFTILNGDGKEINDDIEGVNKDVQGYLDDKLNVSIPTLRKCVLVSSMKYTEFLLSPVSERRAYLEDILDIGVYSDMSDKLKREKSVLKEDLLRLEGTIKTKETNIAVIEEMNQSICDDNAEIIKSKKLEMVDLEDSIKEDKKYIRELSSEIKENSDKSIELKEKVRSLSEIYFHRKELISDRRGALDTKKLDLTSKKSSTKTKLAAIVEESDFFSNNDECYRCKQDIDEDYKEGIITDLTSKKNKIEKTTKKLSVISKKLKESLENISALDAKNQKLKRKISDLKSDISELKSDNVDLANEKKRTMANISSSEKRIESLSGEIKKTAKKKPKKAEDTKSLKLELDSLLDENKKILHDLKVNELSLKVIGDKAIKKYIIKKYIPVLNRFFSKYLEKTGLPFRIAFDDDLKEKILLSGYERLGYKSLSSGERSICDLALMFALLKLSRIKKSIMIDFIYLDEIFDKSIGGSIKKLMDIPRSIAEEEGFNVMINTHRQELLTEFDNTYSVKKGIFSEIKLDGSKGE